MGLAMWHYCWTAEKNLRLGTERKQHHRGVAIEELLVTLERQRAEAGGVQTMQNERLYRIAFRLDGYGEIERWIYHLAVLLDSEQRNDYAVV